MCAITLFPVPLCLFKEISYRSKLKEDMGLRSSKAFVQRLQGTMIVVLNRTLCLRAPKQAVQRSSKLPRLIPATPRPHPTLRTLPPSGTFYKALMVVCFSSWTPFSLCSLQQEPVDPATRYAGVKRNSTTFRKSSSFINQSIDMLDLALKLLYSLI